MKLEFGMYPQSMPTEWTHVRTVRAWLHCWRDRSWKLFDADWASVRCKN